MELVLGRIVHTSILTYLGLHPSLGATSISKSLSKDLIYDRYGFPDTTGISWCIQSSAFIAVRTTRIGPGSY